MTELPIERIVISRAKPIERLSELFYERFFFNDIISNDEDPQLAAANLMAVLAFPGMLCLYWVPKYYVTLARAPQNVIDVSVFGDRFLWLSFEMAVLGLIATLQWDRLFPDRRDYAVLGPQPVSVRLLFEAQGRALFRFLGLFFLIVNVAAAFFFPVGAAPYHASLREGFRFAVAHWISIGAAAAFAVLSISALQGLLTNLLPPRIFERVSALVQAALAAALLGVVVLLPILRGQVVAGADSVYALGEQNEWIWRLPPVWFAALGEVLAGRHVGFLTPAAVTGAIAVVAIFATAVGSYLLSYRRFLQRSLESTHGSRREPTRLWQTTRAHFYRRFLPNLSERAVFDFTLRTLIRNAKQRLYFGAFLAIGAAVIFAQLWKLKTVAEPTPLLLSQPYILLFLALAATRVVFAIPAELPANWAFRFHSAAPLEISLRGIRKAVWSTAVIPLAALTTLTAAALWGGGAAAVHLATILIAAWVTIEAALSGFWKIPFTCNYVAGRAHVIILWTFCATGMLLYSSLSAHLEMSALANPWRLAVYFAVAAVAVRGLTELRRYQAAELEGPIFHDQNDPVVHRLALDS